MVDVSVMSMDRIHADAIISMRAGNIRRQVGVSSGKPLRFPQGVIDVGIPVKVDILMPVATAYLVTKPGKDQYKITFPAVGACCEVAVEATRADSTADGPVTDNLPGSVTEHKDFIEAHKLVAFVKATLQVVAKEEPEDPYAAIARHCMAGYDLQDISTPQKGPKNVRNLIAHDSAGATDNHKQVTSIDCAETPALPSPAADISHVVGSEMQKAMDARDASVVAQSDLNQDIQPGDGPFAGVGAAVLDCSGESQEPHAPVPESRGLLPEAEGYSPISSPHNLLSSPKVMAAMTALAKASADGSIANADA